MCSFSLATDYLVDGGQQDEEETTPQVPVSSGEEETDTENEDRGKQSRKLGREKLTVMKLGREKLTVMCD